MKLAKKVSQRRLAIAAGAFTGIAMLLLFIGIYSAADASRNIADDGYRLQVVDEARLRVTEAQAAQILMLSGGEQAQGTAQAIHDEALSGLRALATRTAEELTPDVTAEILTYIDTAEALDGTDPGFSEVEQLNQQSEALATVLRNERTALTGSLAKSNDRIDSLTALLGVLVAYIIPALAALVFAISMRQQRAVREGSARVTRLEAAAAMRDELVASRLDLIDRALALAAPTETQVSRMLVAETRTIIDSVDGDLVAAPERVVLSHVLAELNASTPTRPGCLLNVEPTDVELGVHIDRLLFSQALRMIIGDAQRRGAELIGVGQDEDEGVAAVWVEHNGRALTESERGLILEQSTLDARSAVERGAPSLRLAYVVRLLEACRATMSIERTYEGEVLRLELPRSARIISEGLPVAATPAPATSS